ncbi:molybdopterin-binding protein [Desulfotalea psychrophila]|uniref:Molybdopterin molybdenumtransferase n=1 Tax=Desulfotalea psychrophila (strain LSv54 / DSM 12343) TaxID=177439 RepID=Q6AMH5_DESPS|nr:molybdopterin-binding protein [Desulfotalea psychrophila]CAG36450.1 probable molybdopterin biosynthesis protein [Desulfotalea psychrophila LSv54]
MKTIAVENAVGTILCHDVTRIIPGKTKEVAFRRGHLIKEEDIPELLAIGKENLYIYDPADGYLHEDDAAIRISEAVAGEGILLSPPSEGKVTVKAARRGLLRIDVDALQQLNMIDNVICSTIHNNQVVAEGRSLAGIRVIPLVIDGAVVAEAEALAAQPLLEVRPLKSLKVGIITTGSEIFKGRIDDAFGPILRSKFAELGCTVLGQRLVADDRAKTVEAIRDFQKEGAEMIVLTGGMSVDPDDQTPASIRDSGADIISYGAPVLPGAMFMLAHLEGIPLLGLPGCVMYHAISIFDLIVPRLLAGVEIKREDIAALGHGGFCEGCDCCHYPVCGFGKGGK